METSTAQESANEDPLLIAVEATRLLGRWTMVGQRHGQGCSCCPPGLGDVAMDDVEKSIMASLKKEHPVLEGRENLALFLKDCVSRTGVKAAPGEIPALLKDVAGVIDDLEKIQLGFY